MLHSATAFCSGPLISMNRTASSLGSDPGELNEETGSHGVLHFILKKQPLLGRHLYFWFQASLGDKHTWRQNAQSILYIEL